MFVRVEIPFVASYAYLEKATTTAFVGPFETEETAGNWKDQFLRQMKEKKVAFATLSNAVAEPTYPATEDPTSVCKKVEQAKVERILAELVLD